MKKIFLISGFIIAIIFDSTGQIVDTLQGNNLRTQEKIKRQYDLEQQLIIHQDTAGMKIFYPDDFVVTNPFNQFIDKAKVIERVKANIIKYSSYERKFDYFRVYGNTAIVIGSEIVVPTTDAARPDAGKIVNRRFTEVWMKRGNKWKKIVRHASNIVAE